MVKGIECFAEVKENADRSFVIVQMFEDFINKFKGGCFSGMAISKTVLTSKEKTMFV